MHPFVTFPSLTSYADVEARMTYEGQTGSGTWWPKIKLHGANGAVVVHPDGTLVAQSRADVLVPGERSGFAAWVHAHADRFATLRADTPMTIFGEWAGGRIQRGQDAVRGLKSPAFFVFAVGLGTMPHPQLDGQIVAAWMITDPDAIAAMLPDVPDLHVLPWAGAPFVLDYAEPAEVLDSIQRLNAEVEALDVRDPYIFERFGIEGPGEGLVLVPRSTEAGQLAGDIYGRLTFKAKVERHRVRKQAKPAVPRQEPPADAFAFVDAYVTEPRCLQGLHEACGGEATKPGIGAFVAWMVRDVLKEGALDMERAGLDAGMLRPLVADKARAWILERIVA